MILSAIEPEMRPFFKDFSQTAVTSHSMLTIHEGQIENIPVALVCCGVCKVNAAIAAQMMSSRYKVKQMIMSGTAGGIDRRLKIGDTVVSTEMAYHDVKDVILTEQHPFMPDLFFKSDTRLVALCQQAVEKNPPSQAVYYGRIVTGETFIATDGRTSIVERFNPLCVDMETAAVAHVCHVNSVPFLSVRSISDTEDDVGYGSFFQNVSMASEHSYEVVRRLLAALSEV